MRAQHMNPAVRMMIHHVMFQEGIVPMEDTTMDMNRALAGLSPEEARKMKRKFRKLWRKELKVMSAKSRKTLQPMMGGPPSRCQKQNRKQRVFDHLYRDKIGPLVIQATNIPEEARLVK
jgi:hypothetical protein